MLETSEPQPQSLCSGHKLRNREILKKPDSLSLKMLASAMVANTEEPKTVIMLQKKIYNYKNVISNKK